MTGIEMLERLRAIDVEEVAIEAATEAEDQMVDAMQDQMAGGLRADGTDIAPPYTNFTIRQKELKSGLSGVTDVVTLFDTGAHYAGMFAKVQGNSILFGSTDWKSEALQKKYGKIYGLTDDSKEFLINDYLYPRFTAKINSLLDTKK